MNLPRRVTLQFLQRIDSERGTSYVRELEMEVDAIPDRGAVMQFWDDVRLYGVKEAVLYVRNGPWSEHVASIGKAWGEISARIEKLTTYRVRNDAGIVSTWDTFKEAKRAIEDEVGTVELVREAEDRWSAKKDGEEVARIIRDD